MCRVIVSVGKIQYISPDGSQGFTVVISPRNENERLYLCSLVDHVCEFAVDTNQSFEEALEWLIDTVQITQEDFYLYFPAVPEPLPVKRSYAPIFLVLRLAASMFRTSSHSGGVVSE
jgi:hypothetical protein